jgi:hypothetical protein
MRFNKSDCVIKPTRLTAYPTLTGKKLNILEKFMPFFFALRSVSRPKTIMKFNVSGKDFLKPSCQLQQMINTISVWRT